MNDDNKDALNNLINSIQEKMNGNESSQKEENNGSFDLSSILNAFNQSKEENSNNTESSFDPSLLLKIQKIISNMNNNNPKKDLLLSLKPFLRKSRQDKLSEYITMLSIAKAIGIFNSKGSDNNVWL